MVVKCPWRETWDLGALHSLVGFVLVLCLAGVLAGCGAGRARAPASPRATGKAHSVRSPACERNPHDGVYLPARLKVLISCAVFRGTVNEAPVKHHDGDVSFQ